MLRTLRKHFALRAFRCLGEQKILPAAGSVVMAVACGDVSVPSDRSTPQAATPRLDVAPKAPGRRAPSTHEAARLALGAPVPPFSVVAADRPHPRCALCEGDRPVTIVAFGGLHDPAFHEDVKDVDAVVQKYGADRVQGLAVVHVAPVGSAPPADLGPRLRVKIPLVALAAGSDHTWLTGLMEHGRAVVLVDGKGLLKYHGIAPRDLFDLNAVLRDELGLEPDATGPGDASSGTGTSPQKRRPEPPPPQGM